MGGVLLDYDRFCPACGEEDRYSYYATDHEAPEPACAFCERCGWNFTETAQHYPRLINVIRYRQDVIRDLRQNLKQLEKWQPQKPNLKKEAV